MPRFPVLAAEPSAAEDLSIKPCCTMVLFTVNRNGGGVLGVEGVVAVMRALRMAF